MGGRKVWGVTSTQVVVLENYDKEEPPEDFLKELLKAPDIVSRIEVSTTTGKILTWVRYATIKGEPSA